MARPLIFLHVFCIGGILATSITHGFTRRRPVRLLQIPPESGICPTDFTDIHRFFVGGFGHADFADDADFFIGYFYSSDFTELIRRFLPMSITHGFTRRRPVRSLQIPPVSGICPTDFTDIHRDNLCKSVKSVGHIPLSGGICNDRTGRLRENP